MVKLLRRGEAQGVVIHKVDRSARNLRDWAELGELIDAGIKVHFANDNLDLNSRGGRLTADIQAVVAADFVRNNREEVKKGLDGRLKQGLWPFAAPVGYLNRGKGTVKTVDPEKAPLVRKAFELFSTGTFTLDTFVDEMAHRGLTNLHGRPFSRDGLWIILRNSFYMGVMRIRRTGASYPGVHTPIITTELFERVQAVLDGRSYTHLRKHDYLFRRRFMCTSCGHALTASTQKGFVYYRCHTKSCDTTSVREDVIDTAVRKLLQSIAIPAEVSQHFPRLLEERRHHARERLTAERASLQSNLERVDARLGRLTDAFVDGTLEKDLFTERKDALLMERARLRDELANLSSSGDRLAEDLREKLQLAESAILLYEAGDPATKREQLAKLTCNRTGSGKNVEIALLPPFDRMANVLNSSQCAHHQDAIATAAEVLALFGA